jgi:acetoin utilization deacetylase AcuC-like enzyme
MSLSLIFSDRFADHAPPAGHPERVERAGVMRAVAGRWRGQGGEVLEPRAATRDEIHRVHAIGYVDRLAAAAGHPTVLDMDTYMSPGSWDAAVLAAGAALTALERVLEPAAAPAGPADRLLRAALALVRPPGHHALRDRAMGFCLLNNAAIMAAAALSRGLARVAIVDYDVHHGNGTQWSFYDDPRVLFVSLHQYPFFPQTGSAGECGVRAGEGFTVNVPMSAGGTDADYLLVLEAVVEPVLAAYAPELLILDVGFDAHDLDPLGQMRLTTAGFGRIARRLRQAAERWCDGRLVLVTEGGYHLGALGESLDATVDVLAEPISSDPGPFAGTPTGRGTAAVALARAAQARYWPGL